MGAEERESRYRKALQRIIAMTNADNPESYRRDDREGCLDTVFAVASEALGQQADQVGDRHE